MHNLNSEFDQLRQTLEQASKIVTSSNVTKQDRTISEQVFLEFRKSKSPYNFCRYLLETCKDPYVHFQAVSTLQEATLREWTLLTSELRSDLQRFLLSYAISATTQQQHTIDKFVLKQILQTLAIFYKRAKLDAAAAAVNKQPTSMTTSSSSAFQSSSSSSSSFSASSSSSSNDPLSATFIHDIISLFKSTTSDIKLKRMCCLLMYALVIEFSNTGKSSKLGVSNDSHFTAKRSFEQNEFKLMLMFVFEATQELIQNLGNNVKSISNLDPDSKEMLYQLFSLIDLSFNWEFTSTKHVLKNLIGNFSQSANGNLNNGNGNGDSSTRGILEPTPEFKAFFLNPSLVSILFKCYELVRDDSDMAHICMQSLIQLSTLSGVIFKNDDGNNGGDVNFRLEFLNNFLRAFVATFSQTQIKEYELFNLSCLMENILSAENVKQLNSIDSQLIEQFFNFACQFVINCFKAEKSCQDSTDSKKYMESYEKVLIEWSSVKDNLPCDEGVQVESTDLFKLIINKYSSPLVEAFVNSRLSNNNELDNEVIQLNEEGLDVESLGGDESADDDLHRYREILYSIGDFARHSADTSLPLLSKLLNEKYSQLVQLLTQAAQELASLKSNASAEEMFTRRLNNISEDVHWLLLISAFTLFEINADTPVDEARIPREIMSYSTRCSSLVNADLTTQLVSRLAQLSVVAAPILSSPSRHHHLQSPILDHIAVDLVQTGLSERDAVDPVTSIFFSSFRLCELEIYARNVLKSDGALFAYLSPQVSETLMWFLRESVHGGYVSLAEKNYDELSPILHLVFAQDTPLGPIVLNFLLRKVIVNFHIWSAENTITSQSAKLLLEMVRNKQICSQLVENEQFWSIGGIVAHPNDLPWSHLPTSVTKLVLKSLVACFAHSNESIDRMRHHFASTILEPLARRMNAANTIAEPSLSAKDLKGLQDLMSLLETLNGLVEGATPALVPHLLAFVLPLLENAVHLLDVFHNYGEIVELILGLFNSIIERFLPFMGDSQLALQKRQFYHSFLCVIQVFSRNNIGKRCLEATIEEDYFSDLLLLMTILNTLHNIDNESVDSRFLNNSSSDPSKPAELNSIEVILVGLKFLIPLMNPEILKFQSLSIEYFKLISRMAYSHPSRLISKSTTTAANTSSEELFPTLINSINYGINSGLGVEVTRLSLECIVPLCDQIYKANLVQTDYGTAMRNLFKVFFEMFFSSPIEMGLFDVCSSVFYSFICCFQDTYQLLVRHLIEHISDETVRAKVLGGFSTLVGGGAAGSFFNMEKRNRIRFGSRFNEFCIKTYALMFIR